MQKVLQFEETNDPLYPKVAVDGRNMVVVALDGKYADTDNLQYDGPVIVTFYSLDSDDKWQRVPSPNRVYSTGDLRRIHSVALSGTTAFIGFPSANDGEVLVYEQNSFGEWVRVDNPNTLQLRPAILDKTSA